MNLRLSEQDLQRRHTLVMDLLRGVAREYTSDDFRGWIAQDVIPDPLTNDIAQGIVAQWDVLQGVLEEEVDQAVREARPDVAQILESPQGLAWANKLVSRVRMEVGMKLLARVFTG